MLFSTPWLWTTGYGDFVTFEPNLSEDLAIPDLWRDLRRRGRIQLSAISEGMLDEITEVQKFRPCRQPPRTRDMFRMNDAHRRCAGNHLPEAMYLKLETVAARSGTGVGPCSVGGI